MNLKHPRVLFKYLLSRVTLVHNYCKVCGRRCEPFSVSDSLWREVVGKNAGNERCINCFHRELREHGHHAEWRLADDTPADA